MKNKHLYNCHELFNDYFFNGQLNYIEINITDYIEIYNYSVWGYYQQGEIKITNNGNIYITLLHEMIHQYQNEFDMCDKDHGKIFKQYACFIELSLNLEKGKI